MLSELVCSSEQLDRPVYSFSDRFPNTFHTQNPRKLKIAAVNNLTDFDLTHALSRASEIMRHDCA